MKVVKDNNFVQIAGWMINRLNLSGNELYCYAIIYGFRQDGDSFFMGSLKYLEQWMNVSRNTVLKSLKGLLEKGLIIKKESVKEKVKLCYYQAIEGKTGGSAISEPGVVQFLNRGGSAISEPNNINDNNIKEKKNILSNDNIKSRDSFDIFWKKYHKGSKKNAFKSWGKLKEQQREKALNNVDSYLLYCKRSDRPLKDVSTYLNGECFNDDWLEVPECYRVNDFDNDRTRRFKEYMVNKFPDLIYHRNPLTFEQGDRLMEDYGVAPFEEAMRRLCGRDIHQYYSIKCGVETILKEMQDDDV